MIKMALYSNVEGKTFLISDPGSVANPYWKKKKNEFWPLPHISHKNKVQVNCRSKCGRLKTSRGTQHIIH